LDSINYKKIKDLISTSDNILITSHHNPDGDALGSAMALHNLFELEGLRTEVMMPNAFPSFLNWMHKSEDVLIYNKHKRKCDKIIENADLIFCLDYNSINRLGEMTEAMSDTKAVKVMIDHHLEPDTDFDFIISVIQTSSTAELVYDFIVKIGLLPKVNKSIADCIYAGIMTDTGSFSYACNYERTFQITAELISLGVDVENVHRLVYDTYSENRMRLLGFCLSERLVVIDDYRTAYIYLSREDMDRYKYQVGDTEGVVNYALAIDNINFAALITHRKDHVRLSFRSIGGFSVNEFARKHFEGGGHKNAAGGNCYSSMEEARKKFENLLPLYSEELTVKKKK